MVRQVTRPQNLDVVFAWTPPCSEVVILFSLGRRTWLFICPESDTSVHAEWLGGLTCFARDGFHRATMQDVCREARLSPGAVYRYINSGLNVLGAIVRDQIERRGCRITRHCTVC